MSHGPLSVQRHILLTRREVELTFSVESGSAPSLSLDGTPLTDIPPTLANIASFRGYAASASFSQAAELLELDHGFVAVMIEQPMPLRVRCGDRVENELLLGVVSGPDPDRRWSPVFAHPSGSDRFGGAAFSFRVTRYFALNGVPIEVFLVRESWLPGPLQEMAAEKRRDYPWAEIHPVGCLKPGDGLSWVHPFQRCAGFVPQRTGGIYIPAPYSGDVISTGDFAIPWDKPENEAEWERWPQLQFLRGRGGITGRQWPRMLDACLGQFRNDVIPPGAGVAAIKERMRLCAKGPEGDEESASSPRSGCFAGYLGNFIEFRRGGKVRLLWTLRGSAGPVFVVDSPDVCACYIFSVGSDGEGPARARAVAWAERSIGYEAARQSAFAFVVHAGDWQERIIGHLTALGVERS